MNQLLINLRSKHDTTRATAAPKAADKLEEFRNSLTEYLLSNVRTPEMIKRAKKALGIK